MIRCQLNENYGHHISRNIGRNESFIHRHRISDELQLYALLLLLRSYVRALFYTPFGVLVLVDRCRVIAVSTLNGKYDDRSNAKAITKTYVIALGLTKVVSLKATYVIAVTKH